MMIQYDRIQLGRQAKELGFVRDTFEKVTRLADILRFMEQDELLSHALALKGGTAINLTIFDLPRLSVDIDLDFAQDVSREEMLADREVITSRIRKYMDAAGYRPMDEWVIVEGMHEPIIDRQTWDIVQEKINSRKRPDGNGNFSIFSGLVHCADCGKTLTVRYNSQRRKLFSCLTYNRYGKSHCTSHSIFYDQLYDAVLKDIQDCAALALADEDAAVAALCEKFSESGTDFMVSAKLSAAERRKQELDTMMDRLYQDWMGGRLNENNFNRMLTNTQSEQETLDQQIAEYRAMLNETSEKQVNIQHWVEMVRRYAGIQELDAQVLNELVSNIVVHNPELIDGELVQNVDIHYTFEVETSLMVSRPKKAS